MGQFSSINCLAVETAAKHQNLPFGRLKPKILPSVQPYEGGVSVGCRGFSRQAIVASTITEDTK